MGEGSFNELLAAVVTFVGGHFLMSSRALRVPLVARMGDKAFRLTYSIIIVLVFWWMLTAFGHAPYHSLWFAPQWAGWVPVLVMPIACILIVAGLASKSPTRAGGEVFFAEGSSQPALGILTITRHPFLWGVALWALSHMAVRGDAASIILFSGMLVLCLGGMWHIDRRRAYEMGASWGPIQLTTSTIPFAAALSGGRPIDWQGIGFWRPLIGIAVYVAILFAHRFLIGVDPLAALR